MDHPSNAGFVDGLEPINALAEASRGFVWRLQGDGGDATNFRPHPDPEVIVNMSVWTAPAALHDFVFRSAHTPFLRRRTEWFTPMGGPQVVAWWIDEGHEPTVDEALVRLAFLAEHGPSPFAFGVARPQPALSIRRTSLDDLEALTLIGELNTTLSLEYPDEGSNHFRLDSDEVSGDSGAFLVARLDDVAVGCGAFRLTGHQQAEIKRMYTRPAARGLKIGAAILVEIERRAADLGVATVRLETGPRSVGARARYERAGYGICDCWGEYAGKPMSVCMSKNLGDR